MISAQHFVFTFLMSELRIIPDTRADKNKQFNYPVQKCWTYTEQPEVLYYLYTCVLQ